MTSNSKNNHVAERNIQLWQKNSEKKKTTGCSNNPWCASAYNEKPEGIIK